MTRPMSWLRRCWGFTLIELLVVISIIALLIALLLPSLGKAKQAAVTTQCLSNMHQIGISYHQYMTDFHQLPGLSYGAFVYAESWGRGPFRGSFLLWSDYWLDPEASTPDYTQSGFLQYGGYGYMGIGYTAMYTGAPGSRDIKHYWCPGTAKNSDPGSGFNYQENQFVFDKRPWDSSNTAGGQVRNTYWYRGGWYYKALLENGNPAWINSGSNASPGPNWIQDGPVSIKPDAPFLPGQSYLTCWTYDYVFPGWPDFVPKWAPHGGEVVNLAQQDGGARTWRMPSPYGAQGKPLHGLFGWYDAECFGADGMYTGATPTNPAYPFYSHMPYWWAIADRKD